MYETKITQALNYSINFVLILAIFAFCHSSAGAEVIIDVDMTSHGQHDTIWLMTPSTFDFYIENDITFYSMSLGFQMWSDDGAIWRWEDVNGLGYATQCVTVVRPSRMSGDPFDMTGFLVTEQDVDLVGRDTIMCGGVGMFGGVTPGNSEHMYSYHFTIRDFDSEGPSTFCIDSSFVPPSGMFVFLDMGGAWMDYSVGWPEGGRCWPVASPQCGDANFDGAVNVGDIVFIIAFVFTGGTTPVPYCAADANGTHPVGVDDAVYLINHIFKGGPPPVEPCCP